MIVLRVSKNGHPLCTAGAEDLAVLHVNVTASGPLGRNTHQVRTEESVDFHLHIGGLTGRQGGPDEHLQWRPDVTLAVGDAIQIELLTSDVADVPDSQEERDAQRHEDKQREEFLYAREIYFQLKDKFEPGSAASNSPL